MRVLVAGGTGVIGRRLVPVLAEAGHEVIIMARGTTGNGKRVPGGHDLLTADALDAKATITAIAQAAPDVVINMLTAMPTELNPKRFAKDLALTNQLRIQGTRNVIAGAKAAGATRVISQALAYAYNPGPDTPATEDEPLWISPPKQFTPALSAIVSLEQQTAAAGGLVLRLGHLYGPGSMYAAKGSFTEQIRAGKLPLVGGGAAVFSFTHADDAAGAVLAAIDQDACGVLNVVDDDPAPMCEWLPYVARLVGGQPPRSAPVFLARLAVGDWGVALMTQLRGADNARARVQLNWRPRYLSWRDGFETELGSRRE
jgi:nucleoside-diphosphate-sugar epimerase